jgi:hypothetical protein
MKLPSPSSPYASPVALRYACARGAFTMVEMLVASTVLILLVVLVTEMVNKTLTLTLNGRKRLDADSEARLVLDRMALDFDQIVQRKDVDYIFAKQSGNDAMFFFSEAPAFYSNTSTSLNAKNSVSLVGYRINNNNTYAPNTPVIERLGKGLTWDGKESGQNTPGGVVFLSGTGTSPDSASTIVGVWGSTIGTSANSFGGNDSNYHILSNQVFRLEICFQVKDLTNPSAPGVAYSNYPVANNATKVSSAPNSASVGDRWYDTTNNRAYLCNGTKSDGTAAWQPNGLDDVLGIVVTIGILDSNSRKLVPNSAYDSMVSALSDPQDSDLTASPPKFIATTWLDAVSTTATFVRQTGISKAAASQVRVYQRIFYLK